jgi:integral membrane protein (TIGR00529 family)
MGESGLMDHLVENMRIGKRAFLAFSPALIGMLPMPGGALLSAPLVKKAGKEVDPGISAGLNVWFRHTLFLIYPLATSLIASAKIANIEVYDVIPYLFAFFVFSMAIGYIFFLRKAIGVMTYKGGFSLKWLLVPLGILLLAPFLDFSLQEILKPEIREVTLVAAVLCSFILAVIVGRLGARGTIKACADMKPWNFALIIIGMFTFFNVFKASEVPEMIVALHLSNVMLCVVVGFALGFFTGRIQLPASIVFPIYLAGGALASMPHTHFAISYFAIFLGYAVSPVHPCVSVSVEYFKIDMNRYFRVMAGPVAIAFLLALAAGLVFM